MTNLELLLTPSENGQSVLTAKRDDKTVHLDKLDLSQQKERAEFLRKLMEKMPELDTDEVERQLIGLAVEQNKPKRSGPKLKRFMPFPVDILPEPVRGFVVSGAAALGCDTTFIVLPLLAALASSIGATRRIKLKETWVEPAVVWAAVVSESGTLKSPSQGLALSIVNRLQACKLQELPELEESYQRDLALHQSDMHFWKTKGRANGEPPPEKPEEPTVERYVVSDITVEALVDRLQNSPRGLLCAVDELAAWFGSLDAYRGGKGGDAAKWLSIHRAESLIVDRKSGLRKTIHVPIAAVSLCGGIQPETLKRVLGTEHVENGLLARLLVTRPPRTPKQWTEATIHPDIMKSMERLFGRLLAFSFGTDENDQLCPIDIPLSPDGKKAWVDFYNAHAKTQSAEEGALAAAFSKIEGYAARLALIVHLIRCAADDPAVNLDTIDRESVETGAAMARWFCYEAERIYAMFCESAENADLRRLVEWIESRGGSVTARDLQRGRRQYKTATDAEAALNELAEAGLGRWETDSHNGGRGRPVARFVLSASKLVDVSTVDINSEKPEENGISVSVDIVNDSENETSEPDAQGVSHG